MGSLRRFVWGFMVMCLIACGEGTLFVSAALGHDEECAYTPSDEYALDRAIYDINRGCARPYTAHLLAENPASDTVLLRSAEVELSTVRNQTILFSDAPVPLPNPFIVIVAAPLAKDGHGVAPVEVIPTEYGRYLDVFEGGRVAANVRLTGETSGGDILESNTFALPIEICDGCLTYCGSWLTGTGRRATIQDLLGGEQCDGSRETGGRVCVDPDC